MWYNTGVTEKQAFLFCLHTTVPNLRLFFCDKITGKSWVRFYVGGAMKKMCCRCKNKLASSEFYKDKRNKDGFRNECKKCSSIGGQKSYQNNIEKYQENHRRYASENKENAREYHKKWYQENKEKRTKQIRFYRDTHQEWYSEYQRQWAKENPEKVKGNAKKWARTHPEKTRERNARRRALIRNARIGKVDYRNIIRRDGYLCHICGEFVNPSNLQFDHIIPLAKGGAHSENNIAVSHSWCNGKKKDRIIPKEELAYGIPKSKRNSR